MKELVLSLTILFSLVIIVGCNDSTGTDDGSNSDDAIQLDAGTVSGNSFSGSWSTSTSGVLSTDDVTINFVTSTELDLYHTNSDGETALLEANYTLHSNINKDASDGFNDTLKIVDVSLGSRSFIYSYIYVYVIDQNNNVTLKMIENKSVAIKENAFTMVPFSGKVKVSNDVDVNFAVAIPFPIDEDGNVWIYDIISYENGIPKDTTEYTLYIWGKDSEGYSLYSDNPNQWAQPVKIENFKMVTNSGDVWGFFKETNIAQLYSGTEAVISCDSVTVDTKFKSWDGKVRTALIDNDRIVDGTNDIYEKRETGTTEKWYITTEGYEGWDRFSPDGILIKKMILKERRYSFSK